MKIFFDHQIFALQKYGGVSKYFAEIISYMRTKEEVVLPLTFSENEYARHFQLGTMHSFLPNVDFRGKGRLLVELGKPKACLQIMSRDYDVYHQTNFDTFGIPFLGKKPMVTTYHDINFLTAHNYNKRMVELQTKSLQRADKVVAISHNTKKDMLSYFDIDEAKIEVIHHGVERFDIPYAFDYSVVDYPYILYVGNRHSFKNFRNFALAFSLIHSKYEEIRIICTGSSFSEEEVSFLNELGILEKVKVIGADEMTMNRLYKYALMFVFPSKYEGFGMPILEAMINECPCVISDASCFPEIAADAALYFDPDDVDSIAATVERFINSEDLRTEYQEKGYNRASEFSWEICAEKHLQLYKTLV